MTLKSVCVFCGSSPGNIPIYRETARRVGQELARRGLRLVYGGGNVGLMGTVADAALEAGGQVVGVIPEALEQKELAHQGLTQLHVVPSMHARKALMAELSEAFLALPGGFGTFEEICEVITWTQLGLHEKPCGLLNVNGFYQGLLQQIDRATEEGFIRAQHRHLVLVDSEPDNMLDQLASYQHQVLPKWLNPAQT